MMRITAADLRVLWDWEITADETVLAVQDGETALLTLSTFDELHQSGHDMAVVITAKDLWEHFDGEWDDEVADSLAGALTTKIN